MSMTTRRLAAALLTLLAAAALSLAAPGIAHAGRSCHAIDATGTGRQTGQATTEATIRNGGLLTGRTDGAFPVAEDIPGGLHIAGTVTFTVNRATLAVDVAGTLLFPGPGSDTVTFDVTSTGMSGTGKLAGADGKLRLVGEQAPDGSFTETVTGRICVDLSPRS